MRYLDQDDVTLVHACLDGDGGAWRALVARYQRFVYAIALRCGLDESSAADVFQAVFERLHENLPQLRQPDRLQAWIGTTARREALRLRQRGRREIAVDPDQPDPFADIPSDDPLPDVALAELRTLDRLRGALERLDDRCRTLLTAIFLEADEEPAYREIADRLGMPIGSLGPTRARCLEKLRKLMLAD